MSVGSSASGGGAPDPEFGSRLALFGAAGLMCLVIVLAFFTPKHKPDAAGEGTPAAH